MRVYAQGFRPKPGGLGPRFRDALLVALGPDYDRLEGPVVLRLRFVFRRTDELAPAPIGEASIAALTRAVLDELAGEAYLDERQVVALHVGKEFGNVNAIEARW